MKPIITILALSTVMVSAVAISAYQMDLDEVGKHATESACKDIALALDQRPSELEVIGLKNYSTPLGKTDAIDWVKNRFEDRSSSLLKLLERGYEENRPMESVITTMDYSTLRGRKNITCSYTLGPLKGYLYMESLTYNRQTFTEDQFLMLRANMLGSTPKRFNYIHDINYLDKLSYLFSLKPINT